jgi:hypothetical protein
MLKKYSVKKLMILLSPVVFNTAKFRRVEMADGSGEVTFEADDATNKLIMEQLFPNADEEVITR